jgi:hypothetical protein
MLNAHQFKNSHFHCSFHNKLALISQLIFVRRFRCLTLEFPIRGGVRLLCEQAELCLCKRFFVCLKLIFCMCFSGTLQFVRIYWAWTLTCVVCSSPVKTTIILCISIIKLPYLVTIPWSLTKFTYRVFCLSSIKEHRKFDAIPIWRYALGSRTRLGVPDQIRTSK